MKFVLLHEARNDDGIKAFFVDVWELYVKVCGVIDWLGLLIEYWILSADNAESVPHSTHADTECSV